MGIRGVESTPSGDARSPGSEPSTVRGFASGRFPARGSRIAAFFHAFREEKLRFISNRNRSASHPRAIPGSSPGRGPGQAFCRLPWVPACAGTTIPCEIQCIGETAVSQQAVPKTRGVFSVPNQSETSAKIWQIVSSVIKSWKHYCFAATFQQWRSTARRRFEVFQKPRPILNPACARCCIYGCRNGGLDPAEAATMCLTRQKAENLRWPLIAWRSMRASARS
jgi:hypothetical protein